MFSVSSVQCCLMKNVCSPLYRYEPPDTVALLHVYSFPLSANITDQGNVKVILSDFPVLELHARFTTVSFKPLSEQQWWWYLLFYISELYKQDLNALNIEEPRPPADIMTICYRCFSIIYHRLYETNETEARIGINYLDIFKTEKNIIIPSSLLWWRIKWNFK